MVMPTQGSWTLENRWSRIKAEVSRTKDFCNKALPAAILYRHEVAEFANVLTNRLTVLDQYTANATVNGLVSYAQTQEADPTLDLVADYTSMRAAMITVRDWIVANAITAGDGTLVLLESYLMN